MSTFWSVMLYRKGDSFRILHRSLHNVWLTPNMFTSYHLFISIYVIHISLYMHYMFVSYYTMPQVVHLFFNFPLFHGFYLLEQLCNSYEVCLLLRCDSVVTRSKSTHFTVNRAVQILECCIIVLRSFLHYVGSGYPWLLPQNKINQQEIDYVT